MNKPTKGYPAAPPLNPWRSLHVCPSLDEPDVITRATDERRRGVRIVRTIAAAALALTITAATGCTEAVTPAPAAAKSKAKSSTKFDPKPGVSVRLVCPADITEDDADRPKLVGYDRDARGNLVIVYRCRTGF